MNEKEFARFEQLYKKHESALKLHGFTPSTLDCYSRALRRVTEFIGCCPDNLTQTQLQGYFVLHPSLKPTPGPPGEWGMEKVGEEVNK